MRLKPLLLASIQVGFVLQGGSLRAQSLQTPATGGAAFSAAPPLVGMGDSLGEGVQSAIAATPTQIHDYLKLIATQMGVTFPLPLLSTTPTAVIGNVAGRARLSPTVPAANLAVSGADSTSILNQQPVSPPQTEADLVLAPYSGSQIAIAESLKSPFMICWIGNNDVLGAILAFDQLNATQITPLSVFKANYDQITSRLGALGGKVVFANIPNVTNVAFLMSPQDLVTFLGSDYGLPQGSYTSLVAMLLIKLGLNNGSILQNPNWVLDATEVQTINNAVAADNQVIAAHAAQINALLADVNSEFSIYEQNPPVIDGVTLTRRYLGGLFSLDGIHPSDIGHALLANGFIRQINSFFGLSIPALTTAQLNSILTSDPFVDFNNNLKVRGRFGVGLLETLGPFLGISGDTTQVPPPGVNPALGRSFMREYFTLTGKDPDTRWTQQDAINAFRTIFKVR
jgi:hypothetical protein